MVSSSGWAWTSSRRRSAVTPGHSSLPLAHPCRARRRACTPRRTSWLTLPRPDRPWDVSQDAEGSAQLIIERGDGTWPRCDPEDCNVMEGPRRSDDLRGPPVLLSRPDSGPVSLGETDVLIA